MYASSPKSEIIETWAETVITVTRDARNQDRLTEHHRYKYHRQTPPRTTIVTFFLNLPLKNIVY